MTDLLTLPASDLVARIAALEGDVERLRAETRTLRNAALNEHNAAIEAAALLADGWSTHVGAAIRGLGR